MFKAGRWSSVLFVSLGLLVIARPAFPDESGSAEVCQAAGTAAERTHGVPPGMLVAIGRVESGRRHPQTGRVSPWPWTINAAGNGRMFDRSEDVIDATQRLKNQGLQSIDVGCFQVNLQHHPNAFRDLAEAFNPRANANYAARFLVSLKAKLKTWEEAIAAYHSSTPELGAPYRDRVLQGWAHPDEGGSSLSPHEPLPAEIGTWSPAILQFGMQVWTPAQNGPAANVIAIRSVPVPKAARAAAATLPAPLISGPLGAKGWSGCAAPLQQSRFSSILRKC